MQISSHTPDQTKRFFANPMISNKTQEIFRKQIKEREIVSKENGIQQLQILKDQQVQRGLQDQPNYKGRINTQFQSPTYASNELFYQDDKGVLKPNAFRAASSQQAQDKFMRTSQVQPPPFQESRTQFLLQQDGEMTRNNFGKRVSLNMKNYSSISIGENDDLRKAYERSASQQSAKSASRINIRNASKQNSLNFSVVSQKVLNQSVIQGHTQQQIGFSPRQIRDKSIQNKKADVNQTSQKATYEGVASDKQLAETKIIWPSKCKQSTGPIPFSKNAKSIPDSGPKKTMVPSVLELGSNTEPDSGNTPRQNKYYELKLLSPKTQSITSVVNNFSGDQFKFMHNEREQSREKMREQIIQRFYKDKANSILNEKAEKLKLQHLQDTNVSLQVGRDDSEIRQQAIWDHYQYIQGQIQCKLAKKNQENSQLQEQNLELRDQIDRFNKWKNQLESKKKEQDKKVIQDGLAKIIQEKSTDQQTSLKCNTQNAQILKQAIRQEYKTRKRESMIENPSMLQGHIQSEMKFRQQQKQEDMNENSAIHEIKIMKPFRMVQ
ncbi:UNKNOWN [Stylonychia lemnae]|uniref:Uncharacterized protein n=1 Tax=Stylonychia lemnae TaxID=5949 RepID=A0A078A6J4_STYLE|nr:UNKNOWN [Stylonychia lemnae]|eukprot:CDW77501.1 UNKNOWN [Stylonychia lemnae]